MTSRASGMHLIDSDQDADCPLPMTVDERALGFQFFQRVGQSQYR